MKNKKTNRIRLVCGNCQWWNFKLGGLPDGKEWGECTNPKYYESMRLSDRLVDYDKIADIKDTEHYRKIRNQVTDYIRVQHEEKTFGCNRFEISPDKKPSLNYVCTCNIPSSGICMKHGTIG